MKVSGLIRDDDAVSPVIGVVLLVAITLILAAVLAAFVLGVGLDQGAPPQTTFDYQYDSDDESLKLGLADGDSFDSDNVIFKFEGGATVRSGVENTWTAAAGESDSFKVHPGDTIHLNASTESILQSGFEETHSVDVIWRTDDEKKSYVIYNWYGKDFDG